MATGSIRVLHVDDDPEFAELAAEFVERHGEDVSVETVTGADAALDRLGSHEYDCVVSDYDMPGRDGLELLAAVREGHPELPFILYTGKGSEEVASRAVSAGVTDYLQKASGTGQYELLANRIEDAVEQRRAKAAVVETERRLQTLARNTTDVLWQFTADWTELLFVNDAYETVWGHSTERLREDPRSMLEGVHPDDRDRLEDAMTALSAGGSVDVEVRVNSGEDYGRWVLFQGDPVLEGEAVVAVGGFARDVTDRKAREQQLKTAYESYEALIEASPVPIWVQGMEEIRYANQAAAELHGFDEPAELVGRSALSFVPPDERAGARQRNERMIEEGEHVERRTGTVEAADGVEREALFAGAPITYYGEDAIVAIARELPAGSADGG